MNVLTLYYRNHGGGCFLRLLGYIEALLKKGHTVHYLSMAPFPLHHQNLVFHRVRIPFKNQYVIAAVFLLYVPFRCITIAKKHRIKLSSVFDWPYAAIVLPLKLFCNIPFIIFQRTDWIFEIKSKRSFPVVLLSKVLIRICIRHCAKLCSVSKNILQNFKKEYPLTHKQSSVIPNNIPLYTPQEIITKKTLLKEYSLPENSFTAGYTGLLNRGKNITHIIRALATLKDKNIVLLIIGDGPEKRKLENLIEKLNLTKKVVIKDWSNKILSFISAIDLIVLPSSYEGSSNTLLEALAANTPCIASDVPGNREMLQNQELLFSLNDPESLQKKLKRILIEPDYYKKIQSLCSERRSLYDFDWETKVTRLSENVVHSHEY